MTKTNREAHKSNNHNDPDRRGPGILVPPPLIVLAVILICYFMIEPIGITFLPKFLRLGLGLFSLCLSAYLCLAALQQFRQYKTAVEPWRSSKCILYSGIFSRTRNPIYLAFFIAQFGIALLVNSLVIVLALPLSIAAIYFFVVRREEAYLEKKFNNEYMEYKGKVSRWWTF